MSWVIGIDEAGYGPNLGPLVQASAAMRLPASDPAGWHALRDVLRRCHEPEDGRLLIDDSKKVNVGPDGVRKLADAVFAASPPTTLAALVGDALADEAWFDGTFPLGAPEPRLPGVTLLPFATATPEFNRIVADAGTKAAALARGLTALARQALALPGDEPLILLCDKHGGRNFYAPMLQDAFPEGWVVAEREGAAESRYRVLNLSRDVTIFFRPRADADSVCVALASMMAKYLREVCMGQFNAFWAKRVPGLVPTAGYPTDARRYYAAIRPAMDYLGITPEQVWRTK